MTLGAFGRNADRGASLFRRHSRLLEIGSVIASLILAVTILRHHGDRAFCVVAVGLCTACLVVWIVVQDLRTFTIADASLLSFACLAVADRTAGGDYIGAIGLDGLLIGGLLLGFREVYYRWKGFDGLGLGDVKLAAAGALLVGASDFSCALFFASAAALGFVALRHSAIVWLGCMIVPVSAQERLPFGAFLAPTVWAIWIARHMPLPSS